MGPGIQATVQFTGGNVCPAVAVASAAETTVDAVAANVCPNGCATSVTEFSVDAAQPPDVDLTPIFSHGSTHRYRIAHDDGETCPCECLGRFGCPPARYVARPGSLTVVFHAADYDQLGTVVAALREQFPSADVKRFVRSPPGTDAGDSVFVNRGKLTPRQLEVLEVAYEMGYFDRPRRANATEIAAVLDIHPSTFREHLSAAETKILEDVL